jgi:phage shock protein C
MATADGICNIVARGEMSMPSGELTRSKSDRMIAGVCGGLAKWLGWDPTAVRILYVLISFFSAAFPGIIVYIILALVMPSEE